MGIRIGNVPTSTLNDTDNILFAEGEAPRKAQYSEMKADIVGSATLLTNADKPKEAINELVQVLLDSVGYGVISGGVVSAQSTPNMTVQVTACTYKTSTGARKTATANSSLTVAAADTANPRIDAIYINSSGVISYLQGTAATSPVAPTTPVGGFLLTQINVSANASSVTNSNIVDMRKILISTDYLNTQLLQKANDTDNARTTTSKTVTGAINELNANKPTVETGTWTPVFKGTTTAGSNTYSQQFGRYIKQGKLVTCYFRLEMSAKDSSMSGNIVIGGLPYIAFNTNANRAGLVIANFANITLASGHSQLCGEIIPGDSNISLIAVGSNTYGVSITATDIALAVIHGSITYESNI